MVLYLRWGKRPDGTSESARKSRRRKDMAVHPGAVGPIIDLDKIVEKYMDWYGVTRTEAKTLIRRDLREII